MAVTANQIIKKQDGCIRSYPVAAVHIYEGTLVYLTAAGYATDVTATGVNGFVGIARSEVDNSGGSAGDLNVEVWAEGDFELTLTGEGDSLDARVGDPELRVAEIFREPSIFASEHLGFDEECEAIVEGHREGVGRLVLLEPGGGEHAQPHGVKFL